MASNVYLCCLALAFVFINSGSGFQNEQIIGETDKFYYLLVRQNVSTDELLNYLEALIPNGTERDNYIRQIGQVGYVLRLPKLAGKGKEMHTFMKKLSHGKPRTGAKKKGLAGPSEDSHATAQPKLSPEAEKIHLHHSDFKDVNDSMLHTPPATTPSKLAKKKSLTSKPKIEERRDLVPSNNAKSPSARKKVQSTAIPLPSNNPVPLREDPVQSKPSSEAVLPVVPLPEDKELKPATLHMDPNDQPSQPMEAPQPVNMGATFPDKIPNEQPDYGGDDGDYYDNSFSPYVPPVDGVRMDEPSFEGMDYPSDSSSESEQEPEMMDNMPPHIMHDMLPPATEDLDEPYPPLKQPDMTKPRNDFLAYHRHGPPSPPTDFSPPGAPMYPRMPSYGDGNILPPDDADYKYSMNDVHNIINSVIDRLRQTPVHRCVEGGQQMQQMQQPRLPARGGAGISTGLRIGFGHRGGLFGLPHLSFKTNPQFYQQMGAALHQQHLADGFKHHESHMLPMPPPPPLFHPPSLNFGLGNIDMNAGGSPPFMTPPQFGFQTNIGGGMGITPPAPLKVQTEFRVPVPHVNIGGGIRGGMGGGIGGGGIGGEIGGGMGGGRIGAGIGGGIGGGRIGAGIDAGIGGGRIGAGIDSGIGGGRIGAGIGSGIGGGRIGAGIDGGIGGGRIGAGIGGGIGGGKIGGSIGIGNARIGGSIGGGIKTNGAIGGPETMTSLPGFKVNTGFEAPMVSLPHIRAELKPPRQVLIQTSTQPNMITVGAGIHLGSHELHHHTSIGKGKNKHTHHIHDPHIELPGDQIATKGNFE